MSTTHGVVQRHGAPPLTPEEAERIARSLHEHTAYHDVRLYSDEEWGAIADALARIEAEEGGEDE